MSIDSYIGEWQLRGYFRSQSIAELGDDGPDYNAIDKWVCGNSFSEIEKMSMASGLTLTIHENGTFNEIKTGSPKIEWFNSEGILDETVKTFDGKAIYIGKLVSLFPSGIPSWATPEEGIYGISCRYDDGDTLISDYLFIVNDQLIRTINTVSDEEHLYRSTLRYVKSTS
ncbi:hypothetical protein NBRC116583_22470 [Arenicella sp. 4NH20-0111]|uniref:hypothetical protein n=1 Tax=Arenicella sp. 4NH20-0111 TaxID=3127648 RepID=UPI0031069042